MSREEAVLERRLRLILLIQSHKHTHVSRCVSTGSDPLQENPQEGLREHLKKTLEFCLSRSALCFCLSAEKRKLQEFMLISLGGK